LAALLKEAQKALAMRMRKEVGIGAAGSVQISRDRKEALGPEEPAAAGDLWQPACAKRRRKLSARYFGRVGMIDRPVALAAAACR
jgi:hypothetical protein